MALLTAERLTLLNDMLQREHIRMLIGLKLDMETNPNAECMKTTMTTAKMTLTRCLFFLFLSFKQLHVQIFVVLVSTKIDESMR